MWGQRGNLTGPRLQSTILTFVQERDRRKEKWAPRWFRPAKDTETFEGEYSLEDCPLWDFTGDYLKLARRGADSTGELF